jgi:hypothetical protein
VLDVFSPEWEVLIEIQTSLQRLQGGVILEYIQGHQDKKLPYLQLPLMAQLNVDADALASMFNRNYPEPRPLAILSPNTRVHLLLGEGTVTSRHTEAIILAATGPPLLQYLCKKYGWTSLDAEVIDWQSHESVFKKLKKRRSHLVKFVHNIMPTNSRLNKFEGGNRRCPSCSATCEDQVHIIRCPHPS